MAAYALANAKCALGAFYRRLSARLGAPKAITATAHKLARIFYRLLTTTLPFRATGHVYYDHQSRPRLPRPLAKNAPILCIRPLPPPHPPHPYTHINTPPTSNP